MNPLKPFYDVFNTGDAKQKLRTLPDFPRMLDVELTSSCNFRCLMCPTGNLSLSRKAEFMQDSTFRRIMRDCEGRGTAIRLIGWGEPLLHPKVAVFVRWAYNRRLPVHINTNGSKMDFTMARRLVNSGLTSIKFSFQGVDRESYAEMRNTDFFNGMLRAIETIRDARADQAFPWISASTTVTDESPEKIEAFRSKMEPLVDELSIGKTIFDYMDLRAVRLKPHEVERLKRLKQSETVEKRHPDPCPEVYDKLSIHADGSVRVCCNDYNGETNLGNVNDVSLSNIWRHQTIEQYRKRLADKQYIGPLCSVCFDYMDCTKHDSTVV